MREEHSILKLVFAAKERPEAADRLIEQYLPYIKSETAKFIGRAPQEGWDDELSIAMFAFYEAAMGYHRDKGAFLPFAARAIRNRLIDEARRLKRHQGHLSLDAPVEEGEEKSLLERVDPGHDQIALHTERAAARGEIADFARDLGEYGLELTDIADNCPRQDRTLAACRRVLTFARENPQVLETMVCTKKLPISALVQGSGVEKKTIERHRKYLLGTLLAYTNGFEMIRGHLQQVGPRKGGARV